MRAATSLTLLLAACGGKDTRTDTRTDTPAGDTAADSGDLDGDGYTEEDGDCDDSDAAIHPGAEEVWYDGTDQDCNGRSDYDADSDGHISDAHDGDDCDDDNPDVRPGVEEVCDGVDNDCDGTTDDDASDQGTWHADLDGDGHGDASTATAACAPPSGHVTDGTDCDDRYASVYPGAPAIACDGLDNDCDPETSEAGLIELDGVQVASIADALAQAGDGAEVVLCEGRYHESDLIAAGPLRISGLGPPEYTTIDAEDQPLLRAAGAVTLANLTLTGGAGTVYGGVAVGGGVLAEDGAVLTLLAVDVTGNTAGDGAGVFVGEGGTLLAEGAAIYGNHGDDSETPVPSGGGIFADDDAVLSLEETTVWGNTAGSGGGITLSTGGALGGGGSTVVSGNEATLNGGGVHAVALDGAPIQIEGVTLSGNVAVAGGGIYCRGMALSSATLAANSSSINGGGVYAIGDITVADTALDGNAAAFNGGGVYSTASVTLARSRLHNNSADFASYGGGVYISGGTVASDSTDWGADETDNTPHDLELGDAEQVLRIDGDSSFTCTDAEGATCAP